MHSSFFFNDTATTEIYTLSLHDALPISLESAFRGDTYTTCVSSRSVPSSPCRSSESMAARKAASVLPEPVGARSEEHTSELQSRLHLVCRLLLEKKNKVVYILYCTQR